MKTLKALVEEIKVYNLDTEEELDLDSLANLDLEELLGMSSDEFGDGEDGSYGELDFNTDIGSMNLDDYELDSDSEFTFSGDSDFDIEDSDFEMDGSEFDTEYSELEGGGIGSTNLDDYEMEDDLGLDDLEGEEFEDDGDFGEEEEDPDFQGDIRTVRGANLVFKRKTEDGNFEELWIYNVGKDIKHETKVRRAILAGTDINPSTQESEDGEQRATTTTTGNVQFLHITGLPQ